MPPLDHDGFRRIPNPYNLPPLFNKTIAKPKYIAIPEYLHSIETLQFLGFQRAKAEEIFADYASTQSQSGDSIADFIRLAVIYITAADMTAIEDAQKGWQPVVDDNTMLMDLAQDYMGIELEGQMYDRIDEPDRDLYLSMVREWVLDTTVRRYHFLCRLDSIFRKYEIARQGKEETEEEGQKQKEAIGQLDPAAAAEEAKRKARNRKKAQAKKAAKQKRKALGTREADYSQAEGDGDVGSQYLLDQDQLAGGAEEEGKDGEE